MRKIFTLFCCAASLATGLAQQESYFTNPVIHGDVADPSIIRIDQTYYIKMCIRDRYYVTNYGWSKNIVHLIQAK